MSNNKQWGAAATAIGRYMETEGWKIVVISSPSVRQSPGADRYNFELVFSFTGARSRNKRTAKKEQER